MTSSHTSALQAVLDELPESMDMEFIEKRLDAAQCLRNLGRIDQEFAEVVGHLVELCEERILWQRLLEHFDLTQRVPRSTSPPLIPFRQGMSLDAGATARTLAMLEFLMHENERLRLKMDAMRITQRNIQQDAKTLWGSGLPGVALLDEADAGVGFEIEEGCLVIWPITRDEHGEVVHEKERALRCRGDLFTLEAVREAFFWATGIRRQSRLEELQRELAAIDSTW